MLKEELDRPGQGQKHTQEALRASKEGTKLLKDHRPCFSQVNGLNMGFVRDKYGLRVPTRSCPGL